MRDDPDGARWRLSPWCHARDPRLNRLRGWLNDLERDVAYEAQGQNAQGWKPHADRCIADARDALARGDREELARCCAQASRFLLHGLTPQQLYERAALLRAECDEKLSGWRKQAVRDLLGPREAPATMTAARLALAQFVIDQHFQNVYFKLEIAAHRLPWIAAALGATAFFALVCSVAVETSQGRSFLADPTETALVLLLGAAGAVLSHSLTVMGATGRIPELIQGAANFIVRPLLGAVSAVAVLVVLQSGLLPVESVTGTRAYAFAVLAGFSDQLLTRAMRRVEETAQG